MFIILGTNDNIILGTLHFSSVLLLRDGFKSHLPHYDFERESLIYKGSQFVIGKRGLNAEQVHLSHGLGLKLPLSWERQISWAWIKRKGNRGFCG